MLSVEVMEGRTLMASGTVTPLLNQPPDGSGTMMLETNGDVIMVGANGNDYWLLTPDSKGNYVDGTWTELANSNMQRLYNGSVILPNGQMMIVGGEYSGPDFNEDDSNEGEIYTPSTNTWADLPTFPQANFGDDMLVNLGSGNVLAGYLLGPQTYLYSQANNTWTQTGTKLFDDPSDEEGYVELPNGDFLCYDIFSSIDNNVGQAQYYVPSTGQWVATQNLPNGEQLSSVECGYEEGGGMLLPDGQVFWIGGNGSTAYYNPTTNAWTAGPSIPGGLVQDDAPVAEASNGTILLSADSVGYNPPTSFFEYNPTTETYTNITSEFPSDYNSGPAYVDRMLDLPNGQILVNDGNSDLVAYTPASPALAANVPAITKIAQNSNGSFTLTGTDINGNSDGAVYGDDAQMASNYPIVSFTSTTGVVSYATTSGFNYQVEQGTKPLTTNFTLPLGLAPGTYAVRVIANGAASAPYGLSIPTKTNDVPTIAQAAKASPNPTYGTTTTLSVLGADPAGESTLTYTWTTLSAPAGAILPSFATNGTNASKSDVATFTQTGAYTFQVTATNDVGLSVTSTVTVNVDPLLTSIALTPTLVQLSPGQTEQFTVSSGLDQFGNQITASSLTWAVTSGGGTVTSSGLYTAPATGTVAVVTVSSGNVSASADVYCLTTPWTQTDVGTPNLTGAAGDNGSGTFTLLSNGSNISGTADQFQFAYLSLPGNGTVQAAVSTLQNTSLTAEAGVVYRNDTTAGSMEVAVLVSQSGGLTFSYRSTTGGTTTTLTLPKVKFPEYLKIVRIGNVFTGYYSANGTAWTQAGSVNVAMGATADAGLASTSSSSGYNTTVFTHVLADATPYIVVAASASPNPVLSTTTNLSVLGGDAAGEQALSYTWSTTASPAGAVAPTFAINGTNAAKNDVVTFYKSGNYTFLVTLSNALGYSVTSSVTVTVTATATTTKMTPAVATVPDGSTQQFLAAVYDQFGFLMPKQPLFTYSMIAGGAGGKVSSQGLYTAPMNRTGIDYINVTGIVNGVQTAAVSTVYVTASLPAVVTTNSGSLATVGSVSVGWGSDSAPLFTANDGLRLLPAGRQTDLPWANIKTLTITLNQAETLTPSDIKVTGLTVANYGPVTVSLVAGTAATYVITLAQPITVADRVTLTISSPEITTYTRRLDVLPGDVNDDGVVNAADATTATAYLATVFLPADIFGDGVITAQDVKAIKLLNGTTLPPLN